MRKLSLLSTMLVVGLVIGLVGSVAFSAEQGASDNFTLTRKNGGITFRVSDGASDIADFKPTSDTDLGSTELEVFSTKNGKTTWTVSVDGVSIISSPSGSNDSKVLEAFGYEIDPDAPGSITIDEAMDTATGRNGKKNIIYNYSWSPMSKSDAAEYVPSGDYTIEVSYTLTSNSTS